jgi:hypothetical protein
MSDNNNSKHALRAIALCLTVAGAFALPSASAQQAEALTSQDGAVVVKDAQSGKLRAATPEEHNALKSAPGQAKKQMLRMAPKPTMNKYHGSGAAGVRLTDEFISTATVVRAADGSLVHQCVDAGGHANHAPHAATPAPTMVTE